MGTSPRASIHEPRFTELVAIGITSILLRVAFALVFSHFHPVTLAGYARMYDGESYQITAAAMQGDRSEYNEYHGRVFPGYPALVALLGATGVGLPAAGIAIDWLSAAFAAAAAASLFHERRVGWGMAVLIPQYLMNSSMAMSEAPLLAFSLGGLLLARRLSTVGAGLLTGVAALIRPMACFAAAGQIMVAIRLRKWRAAIIYGGVAAVVVLAGMLLVRHWRGDALASARYYANNPRAYGGQLMTWPFRALVFVPIEQHIRWPRVVYMWAHALVLLAAGAVLARRWLSYRGFGRRTLDERDLLAGPWLWGNTLFILCIGNVWGFECFHRFTIPAQPAMLWALRSVLPRPSISWRGLIYVLIGAGSWVYALLASLNDFKPLQ